MLTPAALSAIVLAITLVLFVSEKVRHDLVALFALIASLILGLVKPSDAFSGFADPAVVTVAAVLMIGRAIELSGVAAVLARKIVPTKSNFSVRLAILMTIGAVLSAFMNNIAALVITMPIAADIARSSKLPPAAVLMPLAFATIMGGMTTLIGTPANLILSSVRESALGAPFGFFTMGPVGLAVTIVGLIYLSLIGWRLLPVRRSAVEAARPPWRTFELHVPTALADLPFGEAKARLRAASARLIALFRGGATSTLSNESLLRSGDRMLLLSRSSQRAVAEETELTAPHAAEESEDAVTAHVVVAHRSLLIGLSYDDVRTRSDGLVRVVAGGPRVARARRPMALMAIEAGDQLFVRGDPADLAAFIPRARLLEIDRLDYRLVSRRKSAAILSIFAIAIGFVVSGVIGPGIAFMVAAVALAALRLLPSDEVYPSVDWSVIVLLAAMIPVGQSFETSGAASLVAHWLGGVLGGTSLFVTLTVLCSVTLLLSIFLNNVACAVIMGPLGIEVARLLGVSPDAALLAVLVGTSSDFLTPIGHQNNLLVMGPGGYRFSDYSRMGGIMVVLVVATTAAVLSVIYG